MPSGRFFMASLVAASVSQLLACGGSAPPSPPATTPPSSTPTIRGTEHLGWDQRAADAAELATLGYAIYVDSSRTLATGVSCATPAAVAGFACSAALPRMTNGVHTLTLAAISANGDESAQSAPITVNVAATASATANASAPNSRIVATVDGAALNIDPIARGLTQPTDIAVVPDGRLLVADRSGIRVITEGRLLDEPAFAVPQHDAVLALAVDPDFSRTRFVYLAGVSEPPGGKATFWLARFREVGDRLGERAILLDNVPAVAGRAAAALRLGTDGNLYVSFDDGGDTRAAGDLASFNGKLLRLKADGTTPRDQSPSTPVYVAGFHSPRGVDWGPTIGSLWFADADPASKSARLNNVVEKRGATGRTASIQRSYSLSPQTMPSAIVFYRGSAIPQLTGSLLVASDADRRILRVQFDPADATRVRSTSVLLEDVIGGIRAIAAAPDGRLYVATSDAVFVISGQ